MFITSRWQNQRTRGTEEPENCYRFGSEMRKSVECWTERKTTDVCFKYVNTYAYTPLACIAFRNPNRQTIYNRIENLFPLFHSKQKGKCVPTADNFRKMFKRTLHFDFFSSKNRFIDFQQLLQKLLFSVEKLLKNLHASMHFSTKTNLISLKFQWKNVWVSFFGLTWIVTFSNCNQWTGNK